MVTIEGVEIKQNLEELNINEWEKVNGIISRTGSMVEKYLEVFEFLGVKAELLDNLLLEDLRKYIKLFTATTEIKKVETIDLIEIDGFEYRSHTKEDGVIITAKDFKSIEKIFLTEDSNKIAQMLAVLFKRVDLTPKEHYTKAHIKHKAKLFGTQQAILALPFIQIINKELSGIIEDND